MLDVDEAERSVQHTYEEHTVHKGLLQIYSLVGWREQTNQLTNVYAPHGGVDGRKYQVNDVKNARTPHILYLSRTENQHGH